MAESKNMWMVRAGEGGYLFDKFKERDLIGIGFKRVGDLTDVRKKEDVQTKVDDGYSDKTTMARGITVGTLHTFRAEIKTGDWVITYNRNEREYLVGTVDGEYQYTPDQEEGLAHIRQTRWKPKSVARDNLPSDVKSSLGSLRSVFLIGDDSRDEILRQLKVGAQSTERADDAPEPELQGEEIARARLEEEVNQLIEDRISQMSWQDMEKLVAYLLQAMGYSATMTSRGADGGYDVIASPDGLLFEEPRIMVEVKHRKGSIGAPLMRNFIGTIGDSRGFYVSTGGFTLEAKAEAKNNHIVTVDLIQLRQLIVKYYDKFDIEGRMLLPMSKLYLPK